MSFLPVEVFIARCASEDCCCTVYNLRLGTELGSYPPLRNCFVTAFVLQDRIEDGAVVFLLGNKMDAADKKPPNVSRTEGENLAKVCGSCFSGTNPLSSVKLVASPMHSFACDG